jgi:hypothetical protein
VVLAGSRFLTVEPKARDRLQALTGQQIAIRDGKAVITDTAA